MFGNRFVLPRRRSRRTPAQRRELKGCRILPAGLPPFQAGYCAAPPAKVAFPLGRRILGCPGPGLPPFTSSLDIVVVRFPNPASLLKPQACPGGIEFAQMGVLATWIIRSGKSATRMVNPSFTACKRGQARVKSGVVPVFSCLNDGHLMSRKNVFYE